MIQPTDNMIFDTIPGEQYLQTPISLLQAPISAKAKCLYMEAILCYKTYGQINIELLKTLVIEKESAISSALKELIKAGFLHRHREKLSDGTFGKSIYIFTENPKTPEEFLNNFSPEVENPNMENRRLDGSQENQGVCPNLENRRLETPINKYNNIYNNTSSKDNVSSSTSSHSSKKETSYTGSQKPSASAKRQNGLLSSRKQTTSQKKKKDTDTMIAMIYTFTDNENVQQALLEYFRIRRPKGLQPTQWQIILDDLKSFTNNDEKFMIDKIKNATAGGYMTIIASWEKDRKANNYTPRNRFKDDTNDGRDVFIKPAITNVRVGTNTQEENRRIFGYQFETTEDTGV